MVDKLVLGKMYSVDPKIKTGRETGLLFEGVSLFSKCVSSTLPYDEELFVILEIIDREERLVIAERGQTSTAYLVKVLTSQGLIGHLYMNPAGMLLMNDKQRR